MSLYLFAVRRLMRSLVVFASPKALPHLVSERRREV
jgi:hypothetical protein